jgi:hypothetical protein
MRKNLVVTVSKVRKSFARASRKLIFHAVTFRRRAAECRALFADRVALYGFLVVDGLAPETDEMAEVIQDMTA